MHKSRRRQRRRAGLTDLPPGRGTAAIDDVRPPEPAALPLPAIPAKAGDLEAFRKAVEDSAAVSGGLWLSYLFVLFYLGIAASSIKHVDLLVQNPVKLPFLNIELPLLWFFILAPILFLIVHAYTLVHLVLVASRVAQFNEALSKETSEDHDVWRHRLPSNIFVQFLAATAEDRYSSFGRLLAAILWISLVIAAIALLLLLQIQFLPYHSRRITWTSRIVLVLDLGLLWWLWGGILRGRAPSNRAGRWRRRAKLTVGSLLTASVILFACAVATIPGEWQEDHLPSLAFIPTKQGVLPLHDWIFGSGGPPGHAPRDFSRAAVVPNNLILPEFSLYEALKIDDPQKVAWKQYLIDLKGRDLRGASLSGAILTRANFWGAQLQGADLTGAQLQGANLQGAQLQGADLSSSELRGADLFGAQLQGASLSFAQLQGADLGQAQLQGAMLDAAQMEGAWLYLAQLSGAGLAFAQLQGADLGQAQLQGAMLVRSRVWRTRLQQATIKDIFAPAGSPDWNPDWMNIRGGIGRNEAWTDATYAELRQSIERALPEGRRRSDALEHVAILDCGLKGDMLASCDPSAGPPDVVNEWKEVIRAASIDVRAYSKALAAILGDLVCSNEPYSFDVLRGLLFNDRVRSTGDEAPTLVKRITSPECPVSKTFTRPTSAGSPMSGKKCSGTRRSQGILKADTRRPRQRNEISLRREILSRPADDARHCRRGRRAADRLVQRMPASGRARPRRDGYSLWRRNARARLAPAAGVFSVRQPASRYGADRNEAVIPT